MIKIGDNQKEPSLENTPYEEKFSSLSAISRVFFALWNRTLWALETIPIRIPSESFSASVGDRK